MLYLTVFIAVSFLSLGGAQVPNEQPQGTASDKIVYEFKTPPLNYKPCKRQTNTAAPNLQVTGEQSDPAFQSRSIKQIPQGDTQNQQEPPQNLDTSLVPQNQITGPEKNPSRRFFTAGIKGQQCNKSENQILGADDNQGLQKRGISQSQNQPDDNNVEDYVNAYQRMLDDDDGEVEPQRRALSLPTATAESCDPDSKQMSANVDLEKGFRRFNSGKNPSPPPQKMMLSQNSRVCYACSSAANPTCMAPDKRTTVKYCSRGHDSCVVKLFETKGVPIVIRDCASSCKDGPLTNMEPKYSKCSVCHSDLCNGSDIIDSHNVIYICAVYIAIVIKNCI